MMQRSEANCCVLSKSDSACADIVLLRAWPEDTLRMVSVHGGQVPGLIRGSDLEQEKGIRWMPWYQEAMKDVARCEKPWGAASRR
jgi:hypothetical protein